PSAFQPAGPGSAEVVLEPGDLAQQLADLRRQAVPAMEGQRLYRRAFGQGVDPRDLQRRQCAKGGSLGHGQAYPLGRRGPRWRYLSARGRVRGAAVAAHSAPSSAAIAQVIGTTTFAARFGSIAGLDPAT